MYQEYLNQLQVSIAPLSSDELKDLLNNDDKLDEKVDEVLENLKAQKDTLLEENRNKAEKNIEKEPQIIEMRGKINELVDEGKKQCDAVQEKLAQIKEKSGNISQDTALALLQTAAAESEEESDAFMKQLIDKELPIDDFLDSFLPARKTMHLRKLKAEKMTELMRRQTAGGGGSMSGGNQRYSNLPAAGSFYPQFGGGGVPYPLGPMMPMPPPRPY